MAISGFDPTDPRVRLEVVTTELRYKDERIGQLDKSIQHFKLTLDSKERELGELKSEHGQIQLQLGLAHGQLQNIRENKASKQRAFYAALLLALASMAAGWGINLLTATSPNPVGFFLLGGAAILYIIGARLTTLLA